MKGSNNNYEINKQRGWIKIYRSIGEKSWKNKPNYVALWVHLLMEASYAPRRISFRGESYLLKPGQLTTGRRRLSAATGISEASIQRILIYFEKEQQISQETDRQKRIITILNWRDYQQFPGEITDNLHTQNLNNGFSQSETTNAQRTHNEMNNGFHYANSPKTSTCKLGKQKSEQRNEQRTNNERTTNEQRTNTIQEVRIKEEEKEDIYTKFFEEFFWPNYPKRNGKKLGKQETLAAIKRHVKESELPELKTALENYSNSDAAKRGFAKDPKRFIKNRDWSWRDWIVSEKKITFREKYANFLEKG